MVLKNSINQTQTPAPNLPFLDNERVNLIMIICNHCPYVLYRMPAISQLVKDYKDRINIVAVNSNDSADYPQDAPEHMPEFKEKWDLQCDYIYDADQSIARSLNAECTPEFYVINDGKIHYHGELDPAHTTNDLMPSGSVLRHAIDLALVGKDVNWYVHGSFGCSVKWK